MESKIMNGEVSGAKENTRTTDSERRNPVFSGETVKHIVKLRKNLICVCAVYFIISGAMLLLDIAALISGLFDTGPVRPSLLSVVVGFVVFLSIAALIFFIGTYLRDAARAYRRFERSGEIRYIESAIRLMSGFWRLTVICMFAFLGLTLLKFVLFIAAGAA
jgi:hypothetical protein